MTAGRIELSPGDDPVAANQHWWDHNAVDYLSAHAHALPPAEFQWGPEGLTEAQIGLLGSVSQKDVLEIGAGAAQCSRWLALRDVRVTATDLSAEMVHQAERLNEEFGVDFPLIVADARNLPFPDSSFDVVFTAFGVLPFVPNLREVYREVKRVLRCGGAWVYSAMHPVRWMFPDDPTKRGMSVTHSYFANEPYQERTAGGCLEYAEFHHSFSDHINSLTDVGFVVDEILEPQWPAGRDVVWGGWGPERSPYIPGTLIIRSVLPR